MTAAKTRPRAGALGVGYEGCDLQQFVEGLVAAGVETLVDVRLTPISRKRGFSKNALREALATAGIAYEHYRELGNAKSNRAGFGGDADELATARRCYAESISGPDADNVLAGLAGRASSEVLAVLCFEADQARCHRDIVLDEIARRSAST
ncbi:DUF488 domain-containing protein [Amycolatopsis carbonis]|uniref:DUF488 domain-containing protein n=1 Tax=Amycolatopsis carbonis TaxID=715471 RepID=A0A9Y2IBI1_9PSEU|nr:DUF488 domain-containing protein [Amycolatopsis sp. 2-15]WIX76859.1 DUF488 domain-containing protein [Amycolatopsis sp. 2-15]